MVKRGDELELEIVDLGVAYTLYAAALTNLAISYNRKQGISEANQAVHKHQRRLKETLFRFKFDIVIPKNYSSSEEIMDILVSSTIVNNISNHLAREYSSREENIFLFSVIAGGIMTGEVGGVSTETDAAKVQLERIGKSLELPPRIVRMCCKNPERCFEEFKKYLRTLRFRDELAEAVENGIIEVGDSNIAVKHGEIVEKNVDKVKYSDLPLISGEQAFDRMSERARFNLDEKKKALDQARTDSKQFFKFTLVFSILGFFLIVVGIVLIFLKYVNVGVVTSVAGIVPESLAAIFFKKDKELREVIRSYLKTIDESQLILTLVDTAETMSNKGARDTAKREIIRSMLARIS